MPNFDILLASPACQGHSKARGKEKPHHDKSRSTAWAVVDATECHMPKAFVVENVKEFACWKLFPAWISALETLGYKISLDVMNSQFHGVPQHRERVFIVGRLDGKCFDFPDQRGAEIIPFSRAVAWDEGEWSPIDPAARIAIGKRPLVQATMAKIHAGRQRHGKLPFFIPYFGSNCNGWSLEQPIWTITTKDRYALVRGNEMRFIITKEARRAMGFHESYVLTGKSKLDLHLLGNAVVPPVARDLLLKLKRELILAA